MRHDDGLTDGSRNSTVGDFDLSITSEPTDDIGNTFDEAKELRLYSRRGSASAYARGTINYAGDVDMTSFVATQSGLVTVTQRGRGRGRNPGLVGEVAADRKTLPETFIRSR